jgi:hypothetical protein
MLQHRKRGSSFIGLVMLKTHIIYPFLLQACILMDLYETAELPFHATLLANGSWKCNSGFFRTVPTNPSLATCKRCSFFNQSMCPPDTRFENCTTLQDSSCQNCAILPNAWVYIPEKHDCMSKKCNSGFYANNDTSQCLSCPMGSYCFNNTLNHCGENLTTLTVEQSSAFECVPKNKNLAWQIQITFFFSLVNSESVHSDLQFCSKRKDILSSWIRYGRLIDCEGVLDEGYDGGVNCILLIAKPYATEYMQWLNAELINRKEQLIGFMQKCIGDRVISIWNVRILAMEPLSIYYTGGGDSNNNNNNISGDTFSVASPLDVPDIHPSIYNFWGAQGQDIAFFLLAVGILTFSTCISISLLMVGFILQWRRGRINNNNTTTGMLHTA